MDVQNEQYDNLLCLMLCISSARDSNVNPLPLLRKCIIRVYQHSTHPCNRSELLTLLAKEPLIEEVEKEYERVKQIRTEQGLALKGTRECGVHLPA